MVTEAENKKTQALTIENIDRIEKEFYRSGKTSLKVLDHNLQTVFITFPLSPYDPFYQEFHGTILRLIDAGICPSRMNGRIDLKVSQEKRRDEGVPALILTMDDLGIGFIVCSVPLCLSIVTFWFEILVSKISELAVEMRNGLVAFYVARSVTLPRH